MEIKLNLIPPYIKKEIEQSRRLETILSLGRGIFVMAAVFLSFLFGISKVLEVDLEAAVQLEKTGGDFSQYEKIKKMDEEFEKINDQVRNIITVKDDQLYWSDLFEELSLSLKEGIEVSSLTNEDYRITISGEASDRDSLIAYKEKLESNECFSEVNLPLSNLISKNNVAFQIDFKIKEDCLKSL